MKISFYILYAAKKVHTRPKCFGANLILTSRAQKVIYPSASLSHAHFNESILTIFMPETGESFEQPNTGWFF